METDIRLDFLRFLGAGLIVLVWGVGLLQLRRTTTEAVRWLTTSYIAFVAVLAYSPGLFKVDQDTHYYLLTSLALVVGTTLSAFTHDRLRVGNYWKTAWVLLNWSVLAQFNGQITFLLLGYILGLALLAKLASRVKTWSSSIRRYKPLPRAQQARSMRLRPSHSL